MKILASDFDHTIYYLQKDERSIRNSANVDALNDFLDKGNTLIIITGRNYNSIKNVLTPLGLNYTYLVCDDGAKIINNDNESLNTILLNKETIESIVPILEREKCDYYLDDGYNETSDMNNCVKIVINCKDEDEKNKMVDMIKNENIHIYASRTHVNIINKIVNKRDALKKLFELEKLDYDKLYCIGDNDNDYLMLKEFRGAIIKEHNEVLNELNKEEFETIKDYVEYLNNID